MAQLVHHNLDQMNAGGFDWSQPWMVDYFGPTNRFIWWPYQSRVHRVYNQMGKICPDGYNGQKLKLSVACDFSQCNSAIAWVVQNSSLFYQGGPGINFCPGYFDDSNTKNLGTVLDGPIFDGNGNVKDGLDLDSYKNRATIWFHEILRKS